MMYSPGVSQPTGAAGLMAPQAMKPTTRTIPMPRLGIIVRTGRGTPSSEPPGDGARNAATVRLRANV